MTLDGCTPYPAMHTQAVIRKVGEWGPLCMIHKVQFVTWSLFRVKGNYY